MELSVIILAKTDTAASYAMTVNCIDSLMASEPDRSIEVIVVESNKNFHQSGFAFPDFVQVIIPEADFNFHGFLNIGVKASKGDFIALCNNDLLFGSAWFGEIKKVADARPDIVSFSPSGIYHAHPARDFEIGYRIMTHLMGWCFVVRKRVFDIIGPLDETFDFYYADNDYAMVLKWHNLKHAIVYSSFVEHLDKDPEAKIRSYSVDPQTYLHKYQIPDYLRKDHMAGMVMGNERVLSGYLKFHKKWGNPNWVWRKNVVADWLIGNKLGFLVRFFLKIK